MLEIREEILFSFLKISQYSSVMIYNRIVLFTIILLCLLFSGCKKVERLMMISTGLPDSISTNSAIITGRIIDIGEDATLFGHCYSKEQGARVNNPKTEMGPPAGNFFFKSSLSNLEPGTKYYVKAYIRNDQGITYGKEVNFTTLPLKPSFKGSVIENATPYLLEIEFDNQLANVVPSPSSFSVAVNSEARIVSEVVIIQNKIILTLSHVVQGGDIVTIAYSVPASNPVQTPSGGLASPIAVTNVLNKVNLAPVLEQAAIEDYSPTLLEITFDQILANIVPSASAFTVMVNSVVRSVSTIAITDNKVRLVLSKFVKTGENVTVSYTKPAVNFLQTPSGGQVQSFPAKIVTNNVR